jgi:hypothetical protein
MNLLKRAETQLALVVEVVTRLPLVPVQCHDSIRSTGFARTSVEAATETAATEKNALLERVAALALLLLLLSLRPRRCDADLGQPKIRLLVVMVAGTVAAVVAATTLAYGQRMEAVEEAFEMTLAFPAAVV